MKFHELFDWANRHITACEIENLDFLGNVGHSIATRREDRQYIEAGNTCALQDVPFFTLEPHVRQAGGRWGFKGEATIAGDLVLTQDHRVPALQ